MTSGVVEAVTVALMFVALVWVVLRFRLPHNVLTGPFLAVLLATLASTLVSVDPGGSVARVVVIAGGISTYYVALAHRRWAAIALQIAAYVMVAAVIAELVGGVARPAGLLSNPNAAASALLLVSWVAWPLAMAPLVILSRGALVAALAVQLFRLSRRWLVLGLLVVAAVAIALCLLRVGTVEKRLGTWAEALRLFLERPVLGWGPGSYCRLARVEPGHMHADSLPLTLAAEGGIVGLVAWAWLGITVVRSARAGPQARGLLAWGLHQIVDCTIFFPVVLVLLAMSVAEVTHGHGVWAETGEQRAAIPEPSQVAVADGDTARVCAQSAVRSQ